MNEHVRDPGMENVELALKALREASTGVGASEHMEGNLRQAFRSQHSKSKSRRYPWLAGAIAASLVVAAAVQLWKVPVVNTPEPPVIAKKDVVAPPPPEPKVEIATPAARPVKRRAPVRIDREVATDFFPIPYAPVLTQMDRGQVIRVRLPAISMRNFGLPVSEERMSDRVRADVLLGEDGIARAIRFVR